MQSNTACRRLTPVRTLFMAFALVSVAVALGLAPYSASATPAPDAGFHRSAVPAAAMPWTPPSPAFRVYVEADGLYRLDYAYLAAAGLPVDSVDPATFRMHFMGEEIPLRVLDNGDARFDPGDAVIFYGRSVDSLFLAGLAPSRIYTAASVFWLSYGGATGLRMAERPSLAGGVLSETHRRNRRSELQNLYRSSRPMLPAADHWFAENLSSGVNPGQRSFTFILGDLPAGSHTASLQVSVQGNRDGGHRLRVFINGTQLLDDATSWGGFDLFQPVMEFDQTLLVKGSNQVVVQLVSGVDGKTSDAALTDWAALTHSDTHTASGDLLLFEADQSAGCGGDPVCAYAVSGFSGPQIDLYDVTALSGVGRITDGQVGGAYTISFSDATPAARSYAAVGAAGYKIPQKIEAATFNVSPYTPANLLATDVGADYIIVTHPDFWAQALKLAQHRGKRFRVAVIDARQIYDQFNGGQMSAESIRDFFKFAYFNWQQPAPAYALLFGDGTYDMRNYRGTSAPTYIPPYLELVDPDMGETAADNRFVTLAGEDVLPDIALGRFVANTLAEADALAQKTIDYEVGCRCGGWNYNALFLTDDLEGGGGNFYAYSNEIADGYADAEQTVPLIPSTFDIQKVYLGQTCDAVGNPSIANECRQQTVNTLNGAGALFLSYVGHSTKTEWATEKMMDGSLIASLTNGPCLPINLAMTCLEGFYHEAGQAVASLAEVAVRIPTHGAVASWSPTGLGLVTGHDYLERGLMLALFHQGFTRLGPATNSAKQYLWDNAGGQHRDLVDTFVLLGDPALEVKTEAVCLAPTAVTLAGFDAAANRRGIRLTWTTEDEREIIAFNVLRRPAGPDSSTAGVYRILNQAPIMAKKAGLSEGARYAFGDATARPGVPYDYALEVVSTDGGSQQFGPLQATAGYLPFATPPVLDK